MAKTQQTTVRYIVDLHDSPVIVRETKTVVKDGRGTNWAAGSTEREVLATLTPRQVAALIESAADTLGYILSEDYKAEQAEKEG